MHRLQIFLLALCPVFAYSADNPVHVSVYYESLCPDSIQFFTQQLYPTYTNATYLQKFMNLTLVPYGKSTRQNLGNDTWNFTCHHGPNECYGNKVQACVLTHTKHQQDQLKLINCLMANGKRDSHYPLEECRQSTGLDVDNIKNCANSTEGDQLLNSMGILTDKFSEKFGFKNVPTIVFNDVFKQTAQNLAIDNFQSALCSNIKTGAPKECSASSASIFTISLIGLFIVSLSYQIMA